MNRRDFVKFGGVAAIELGAARLLMSQAQPGMPGTQTNAVAPEISKPDFTLRIAPVTVELTPTRVISTIGYNGTSPGPLLRMREGKPVTVEVINETDVPELVHWHGLMIPPEVDGVEEEATPMVPPRGRIRSNSKRTCSIPAHRRRAPPWGARLFGGCSMPTSRLGPMPPSGSCTRHCSPRCPSTRRPI